MTISQIVKSNNNVLEKRFLKSIQELPKHKINPTCKDDDAFNEPIVELSQTEKSNLKNLINEI